MNKRKLAVQYFACLVLVATVAISLIIFTALTHMGILRCPLSLPGALFLRFVLFSLRRCWVAFPGRSALAQAVPELHVSSFRHAACLNFAGFRSSWDFFAYRILLSTIVCDIAVLLLLVVEVSCLAFWRFWETIRVILLSMILLG